MGKPAAFDPASEVADPSGVIARLKEFFAAKTDGDLARALGVPRSTVGSWVSRGSIPHNVLISLAIERGISLDWVIFGEGSFMRERGYAYDPELLRLNVWAIAANPQYVEMGPEFIGRLAVVQYEKSVDRTMSKGGYYRDKVDREKEIAELKAVISYYNSRYAS